MLKKLFYYEMKYSARMFLLTHLVALFVSFGLFGVQRHFEFSERNPFLLAAQISVILLLVCVTFYTWLNIGMRFYRTVFGDQGYLTNTLPVTPHQILLSHFFPGLLWMSADLLLLFVCMSLVGNLNLFFELAAEAARTPGSAGFWIWCLLLCIAGLLLSLIQILCGVAVGNLFNGHRAIGSVIALFFLNFVTQTISSLPLFFCFDFRELFRLPSGNLTLAEFQSTFPGVYHGLYRMFIWETVLGLAMFAALCLLTLRLLDKHLNLE